MKFLFYSSDGKESIQLPVNPPVFHVSDGSSVNTIETIGMGEITIIGKEKPVEITLESHFPAEAGRYLHFLKDAEIADITVARTPYEYIGILKRWKALEKAIRLIITDTPVNIPVVIENLTYGEEGGSRDVKYELQLREYRTYELKSTLDGPKVVAASSDTSQSRKDQAAPEGVYIVKAGDCLWKIAKKVYGDGSRYKEIMTRNKLKTDLILVGQRLKV
ncbi:MAG TPA: LysM peptidoglycan-binding domain-containing protein [Negativicutes bacterium]|nr:LysM peptidoglycan-binding domain-containing protein [Negativicutes bacterium]